MTIEALSREVHGQHQDQVKGSSRRARSDAPWMWRRMIRRCDADGGRAGKRAGNGNSVFTGIRTRFGASVVVNTGSITVNIAPTEASTIAAECANLRRRHQGRGPGHPKDSLHGSVNMTGAQVKTRRFEHADNAHPVPDRPSSNSGLRNLPVSLGNPVVFGLCSGSFSPLAGSVPHGPFIGRSRNLLDCADSCA